MNRKLTPAKLPLPRFRSDNETAAYFETHSAAEVWDQLPQARQTKLSAALEESIRDRHARAKSHVPKTQTVGESVIQGLNEAIAWTRGENNDVRVTEIRVPKADAS